MAGMSAVMWVCAGIAVLVAVAVAVFLPERRSSVADLEPSVTMAV